MKNLLKNIKCIFGRHDWEKSVIDCYHLVLENDLHCLFYADIEYKCNHCGKTVIEEKKRL